VRAVARAEPASKVTSLANGNASQVRADTQHDEPFGLLDAVLVGLRVAQGFPLGVFGFFDFGLGAVADEDGLASPFDNDLGGVSQRSRFGGVSRNCRRTFLPSGIAARSISTLAWARTSADADMLTRKSGARRVSGCVLHQLSARYHPQNSQLLSHSFLEPVPSNAHTIQLVANSQSWW
jgi:hypothetical protein